MANPIKDRSLTESFIDTLSIPGGLVRKGLIDGINREDFDIDSYIDIIKKEKRVEPGQFVEAIEDSTGLDLTPGSRNYAEKTWGEKVGTFARDFTIDVFTSPDSLIGAPAKLLKAGGAFKAIKNPILQKAASDAVMGATFGALSVDGDDEITEMIQKVAVGAAGGAAIRPGLTQVGKVGKQLGRTVVDPIVENFNSGVINKFRDKAVARKIQDITEAGVAAGKTEEEMAFEIAEATSSIREQTRFTNLTKTAEGSRAKTTQYERDYLQTKERLDESFLNDLYNSGAGPEQMKKSLFEYDTLMGKGLSSTILLREALTKIGKAERQAIGSLGLDTQKFKQGYGSLYNVFKAETGDGKLAKELADKYSNNIKDVVKQNGISFSDDAIGLRAGKIANGIAANDIIFPKIANNPYKDEITRAIYKHIDANHDLTLEYNDFARKAWPDADRTFEAIDFHSVDLKTIDKELAAEGIPSTAEGVRRRYSDIVEATRDGISRSQAQEIGAKRYAKMFLSNTENQARQLLTEIGENVKADQSFLGKTFRTYDEILKLSKTVMLATGFSWSINNFPDNIIKAYMAAGPKAALKVGGHSLLSTGYALGNMVNAKAMNKLVDDGNLYKQLAGVFDPNSSIKKLKYDREIMTVASDLGVIDNTKMDDLLRMGNDDLLDLTPISRGAKETYKEMAKGKKSLTEVSNGAQRFFWDKVGRIGSSAENTGRYITFRETMKSFYDKYPEGAKLLKRDNPNYVSLLSKEALINESSPLKKKAVQEARAIMKEAADVTNAAFFDYQDVNVFEKYVMKRIFPFWTFTSKNLNFWTDKILSPETIGKVGKVGSINEAMGRGPTERERLGAPDYLLEKAARFRKGKNGLEAVTTPNLSLFDALDVAPIFGNIEGAAKSGGNRVAPLLKEGIQQAFNIDLFTGTNLTPTERMPKKRLFESALTSMPDAALEAMGIVRDRDGNLFTNNEAAARLQSLTKALPIPGMPLLDAFARGKRDNRFRDDSVGEAIGNQVSPVKVKNLKRAKLNKARKKNLIKLRKLRGNKAELLKDRRRSSRGRQSRSGRTGRQGRN